MSAYQRLGLSAVGGYMLVITLWVLPRETTVVVLLSAAVTGGIWCAWEAVSFWNTVSSELARMQADQKAKRRAD